MAEQKRCEGLPSLGPAHPGLRGEALPPLQFENGKASLAQGVQAAWILGLSSLVLERLRWKRARKLLEGVDNMWFLAIISATSSVDVEISLQNAPKWLSLP